MLKLVVELRNLYVSRLSKGKNASQASRLSQGNHTNLGICERAMRRKEGYAESKDYPNEFNQDVWMKSPLEYVDMIPTPEPTITPEPSPYPAFLSLHAFGFLFTILGIVAAIYLIRRKREGIR